MRNLLQDGSTSAQFGFIHSCNQHLPSLPVVLSSKKIYFYSLERKKKVALPHEMHTHKGVHISQEHGTERFYPSGKAALDSDKGHKIKCEGQP